MGAGDKIDHHAEVLKGKVKEAAGPSSAIGSSRVSSASIRVDLPGQRRRQSG